MASTSFADVNAVLNRLTVLLQDGAFADAANLAAGARLQYPVAAELVRLHGTALLQLGRFKEAQMALVRAAELAPESVETQCSLAAIALSGGRADDAIERMRAMLHRSPNHPAALQMLGSALMAAARHAEASEAFALALQAMPQHPGLCLDLADAELQLGHARQAEARVREALQLAPSSDAAHTLLGQVLQMQGRSREALDAWLQAERLAPGNAQYPCEAGRILERMGVLETAADAYDRALRLDPNYIPALGRLVFLRRRQGLRGRHRATDRTAAPAARLHAPPARAGHADTRGLRRRRLQRTRHRLVGGRAARSLARQAAGAPPVRHDAGRRRHYPSPAGQRRPLARCLGARSGADGPADPRGRHRDPDRPQRLCRQRRCRADGVVRRAGTGELAGLPRHVGRALDGLPAGRCRDAARQLAPPRPRKTAAPAALLPTQRRHPHRAAPARACGMRPARARHRVRLLQRQPQAQRDFVRADDEDPAAGAWQRAVAALRPGRRGRSPARRGHRRRHRAGAAGLPAAPAAPGIPGTLQPRRPVA